MSDSDNDLFGFIARRADIKSDMSAEEMKAAFARLNYAADVFEGTVKFMVQEITFAGSAEEFANALFKYNFRQL